MAPLGLTLDDAPDRAEGGSGEAPVAPRLEGLVDDHHAFIWRSLRRLGVPQGDVDDAAQKVFLTASRKLARIRPGSEKSFLFQTAVRVASDSRRTIRRRREVPEETNDEPTSAAPDAEQMIDLRRARAKLDAILDAMPMELRAVFVLFELDEMPTQEIAALLDVPVGTASSRLRRARAEFSVQVARMQRRERAPGGDPR